MFAINDRIEVQVDSSRLGIGESVIGIRWTISAFVMLSLCACGLQPSASVSNPSVEDIIAGTAAAAQTQTATHLPSATPTYTSTVTLTPVIPSATATSTFPFGIFVEAPLIAEVETPNSLLVGATSSSNGSGEHIKYTDELWSCTIVGKSPPKNATVKPGSNFYVSWTVVNNGTKTWTRNGVDFVYDAGFRHDGGPVQDISKTILPGGRITLKVLIVPPKKEDVYNVIWSLKVGQTKFCHMKVSFEVKK